ncbi:hypothetical protein [Faecalibacillus faecis]|uniref:hypothetical protein n=1 Tax=Faecalibacillus faecis TaxID=1982628 RepID=UPI00386736B9
MKTTKIRKEKDDFLVFAKLCFENLDNRSSVFLKNAYKVDLLRDKFSKSVLYNYFLYSKRYLKDGYKVKAMPHVLCEVIDSLRQKCEQKVEAVKPKQLSYEEIIKHIDNEISNLEERVKTQFDKNMKQIQLLTRMNNDMVQYRESKMQEINEKKERLIKEYFERI